MSRWAVCEVDELPTYSSGRVVLLGDAVSLAGTRLIQNINVTSQGSRYDSQSGHGSRADDRGNFQYNMLSSILTWL